MANSIARKSTILYTLDLEAPSRQDKKHWVNIWTTLPP
jgi:hypothetical protein